MRTRTLLGAATAVLLVAALGCFAQAWRSGGQRHLVPYRAAHVAATPPDTPPDVPPDRAPPRVAPPAPAGVAAPVRVVVPAVGLSARVVPVALGREGQMELPAPSVAGWYVQGPAPGAPGPAVLVGHVDTYKGPAVFYRLTGISPGDEVRVVRADGRRSTFVISKVTLIRKAAFPSKAVFGPTAKAAIRLITCTGPFDTSTGSYVDSLIAWGELVRPSPPAHRTPGHAGA